MPDVRKISNNSKNLFSKNTSTKNLPATPENSFDNPTRLDLSNFRRTIYLNIWNQITSLKTLWKRQKFIKKPPLDSKRAVLTILSKNFTEFQIFPLKFRWKAKTFFPKKDNVMQKVPLNKCRKQFLKPSAKLSDWSPQSFWSKLETNVKVNILFRKQRSEMHLLKPGGSLFDKSQQSFSSKLEKMTKLFFSSNINFSPKTSFVHVKCSFDKTFKAFEPICQKFFLTAWKQ